MTIADLAQPAPAPAPRPGRRGHSVVIGVSIALLLGAGGVTGATYYYDSVPLAESTVTYPVVTVAELPPTVANAFVAAVDPGFYSSDDSPLTRRYVEIAAGAEPGLRTRIMAGKAEAAYPKEEILERFLNRADYGRGAIGLVAAARTYFQKAPAQLSVPEAALLAVQLDPDHPAPKPAWDQVLDTMVDRGWLSPGARDTFTYPG
ncbi:transglycosylase domain-containing protein [Actinoplanes philippinensis]|uniref:transglycosylase domain-containing protein n=1 Tax=Actinoplanes philippinensis TaxID=35752 RepID=UPI0034081184